MEIIQRGLRISIDMSDNTSEDGPIRALRPPFCIKILQLDFFTTEVIREASKLGWLILFPLFIIKPVLLYALPDRVAVRLEPGSHTGQTRPDGLTSSIKPLF